MALIGYKYMLDVTTIRRSEVARATGADPAHISRIFSGKVNPSLSLGLKIARHLGVSVEELCAALGIDTAGSSPATQTGESRLRATIERVNPEVDGGHFPIKRTVGESVEVEADVFTVGHDAVLGLMLHRKVGAPKWSEVSLEAMGNDLWTAQFVVTDLGEYEYTVTAWVDRFATWVRDLRKRVAAGQDVSIDLLIGAGLLEEAAPTASRGDRRLLEGWAASLGRTDKEGLSERVKLALDGKVAEAMFRNRDVALATTYEKVLKVVVDREKARFSAWYEMFPRSNSPEKGKHGTFKDCETRLDYVASMGFDVLYLPPVHPIGHTGRKGGNNALVAGADDPGSPWSIGSDEGGHTSVHPELGTIEDFRRLVKAAAEKGLEVALDLAFQCSADHPYVREHPEWFQLRPDGTVQYAENPPKKYEDIYPLNFESDDWRGLWEELKGVVLFWAKQGVRIFRVDNPHTKPFTFWEWLIGEVRKEYPDVFFLAEAFTRPKVMYQLAKLGFNQSYTYFAWRNNKSELTEYLDELTQTEVREYFRPNFWPNTPDILTEHLQTGGRPAFVARLVLAATLSSNYGIYGPAFEQCEATPREAGSEEYLDSEKYQVRQWDIERADSLHEFIGRINRIRRDNPALHGNESLRFHQVDNDHIICYSKASDDKENVMLMVVNLDPHHTHSGSVDLSLIELGIESGEAYRVHDLLTDARYIWTGPHNYVSLDPAIVPAHVFLLRRKVRTEQDFDYFL